jgi:hypothetical protein
MTTSSKDNFIKHSIPFQETKQPQSLSTLSYNLGQYKVIVVIPAYNEGSYIGSVMAKYPVNVIGADDGSIRINLTVDPINASYISKLYLFKPLFY